MNPLNSKLAFIWLFKFWLTLICLWTFWFTLVLFLLSCLSIGFVLFLISWLTLGFSYFFLVFSSSLLGFFSVSLLSSLSLFLSFWFLIYALKFSLNKCQGFYFLFKINSSQFLQSFICNYLHICSYAVLRNPKCSYVFNIFFLNSFN